MSDVRSLLSALVRNHLIWLVLLATCTFGAVFIQGFVSLQNFTNVLWAAAPLGMMVLGMFFVMLTGGLDLSLESSFAVAPVLAVVLMMQTAPDIVSPPIAILLTLAIGILVGLFNGTFSVRLKVNPFLVTLAMLLFLRGIVIYLIPEGVYYLPEAYTFLGKFKIADEIPVSIIVLLIIYTLGYVLINRTSFGKNIYAIGNNEQAAYVAGINVSRTKILTFAAAGLFAAIGGMLEAGRLNAVVADMGEGQIMMVFAGVILGGTSLSGGQGRITGILGAVLLLAVLENLMNLFGVMPSVRQMVFGAILLGAIWLASLQERANRTTA